MKLHIAVALLAACLGLTACGPGDENNETSNDSNNTTNNTTGTSNDTDGGDPAQATVEDGEGGDIDCPRGMASPDDVPAAADILTVDVDYDGTQVVMTITYAGDAQTLAESSDGTSFNGNVQAGIGTLYPFSVKQSSGQWENSSGSLATEFSAEWTSNSVAVITVGGFEAGGGGITKAEAFTQAPVDNWCDRVVVDL